MSETAVATAPASETPRCSSCLHGQCDHYGVQNLFVRKALWRCKRCGHTFARVIKPGEKLPPIVRR